MLSIHMPENLDKSEIKEGLDDLEIWGIENNRLVTRIEFDNYRDTVFFSNMVFSLAEECFHHPEVKVEYGAVEIDVYTHDTIGITEKDFELARLIEDKLKDIEWS